MLRNKDSEITNLKLELQKLRNTYEKEVKKVMKQQATSLNTGGNMTTGGSGGNVDGMLGAPSAKMNQTFSFDPYSASSSKRGQTIMLTSENPFNNP